jgi:four helix bundle protein
MTNIDSDELFHFEKLIAYQKALDYIDFVYELTSKFPQHELYGMTSQWRRASCSIALNTGEGAGSTDNDFNNFLRIAKRSLRECVVCTTIALRRKYILNEENNNSRNKLTELARLNSGLVKSIKNKKAGTTLPTPSSLQNDLPTPNSLLK